MSRATLVRESAAAAVSADGRRLRRLLAEAPGGAEPLLEHVHAAIRGDRLEVTFFLQAADQHEADVMAHLLAARLSVLLPGWGLRG
ncbi:hypothetical protein [Catellatospora sp. TT07R-123]|uniref:hypothetical protein n=1 Tax=Catellatospora sp. TT07R-123 TaxID=2733863 RepID=UPI001BB37232|nr:hypothetical protein [Catellatospora sp. TT07R-123]